MKKAAKKFLYVRRESFKKQRALIAVVLSRAGHAPVWKEVASANICQTKLHVSKIKFKKNCNNQTNNNEKKRNGEHIIVVPQNSPPNSVRQIVPYHRVSMHVSQHVHEVSTSQ